MDELRYGAGDRPDASLEREYFFYVCVLNGKPVPSIFTVTYSGTMCAVKCPPVSPTAPFRNSVSSSCHFYWMQTKIFRKKLSTSSLSVVITVPAQEEFLMRDAK